MLQFDENGSRRQNAPIDFMKNFGITKANEVIQWTGVGNDDHASDYRLFVARTRPSVAMSLSRSSTV